MSASPSHRYAAATVTPTGRWQRRGPWWARHELQQYSVHLSPEPASWPDAYDEVYAANDEEAEKLTAQLLTRRNAALAAQDELDARARTVIA